MARCDAGDIGPDYQPGHAHGDMLSFELSLNGHRVIVDSGVHRGLVDMAYNTRRSECETAAIHFGVRALRDVSLKAFKNRAQELAPTVRRRARHVITENDRTVSAAGALEAGDLKAFGKLIKPFEFLFLCFVFYCST